MHRPICKKMLWKKYPHEIQNKFMKILFIGGTGTISSACLLALINAGHNISVLCRGTRNQRIPAGVTIYKGDAYQLDETVESEILNNEWDCIVNWAVYNAEQAALDIKRFAAVTSHYIFISTTSVYDGSNKMNPISETQAYVASDWIYSKGKIAAEQKFLEAFRTINFPVTIIRPGHTYADFTVPTNIQGLGYGLIKRIETSQPVLIHGDGNSLWTLTHSEDFANAFIQLLNKKSIQGEIFHLTSEQHCTWNDIFAIYSNLLGKKIQKVYMEPEEIMRRSPIIGEPIVSDKIYNRYFNLEKINKYITMHPQISLTDGLEKVMRWHKTNLNGIKPNLAVESELDKLLN